MSVLRRNLKIKMILPALTEANSPFFPHHQIFEKSVGELA